MAKRLIGVISDTHNLLRPEAASALEGADLIVHAGDVCRPDVLAELKNIAPVVAVRGNNDDGSWARELPVFTTIEIERVLIFVIHDLKEMNINPAAEKINVVISGHTHKPRIEHGSDGILYLNPGSAGRRRFKLPVTLARLQIEGCNAKARIIELPIE